jgi:DNA-binding NarL/FixJ family response regulator
MNIRVLLVDDFPLMRDGMAVALQADGAIEIVGCADTAESGFAAAQRHRPDVMLVDMRMPGASGMSLLERLTAELPEIKVLVVTASEKLDTLLQAVSAGAAGYLTKRATPRELIDAVITIHAGGSVVAPDLAAEVLRDYARMASDPGGRTVSSRALLTSREREIVGLVSDGMTDKEIAAKLYVSPRTVQNQLTRIREKTGSIRRSDLARWAVEHLGT